MKPHPALTLAMIIGVDAGAHLIEELTRLEEARGRVQRLRGKAILEPREGDEQLGEHAWRLGALTREQERELAFDRADREHTAPDVGIAGEGGATWAVAPGYVAWGKPRSTPRSPGSGQRTVTAL